MIPTWQRYFIFIILFSIPSAFCQTGLQTGDVTGDGVIDGRDALRIMRSIEGMDSLGELDSTYADVYPLGGDGQLTVDDVNKILRYSVGLTPESEITGEIGDGQPVITDFTPHSGPIGTQVTISGKYFLSETQGENMVFFGDALAPVIEANATTIVTQVPSGAQTSAIRVVTPSGEAVSPDEFSVTSPSQGLLVLDGNLNPSNFTIINGYEEIDDIGEDGAFQIAASNTDLTMVAAVPKEDGNHTYMSLWFPTDSTGPAKVRAAAEGPKVIDAYTTAKSLIFLCPLFTNLDKAAARVLFETMEGVPEVTALAQTISQRYPQRVEGLDDPTVEEAWIAACVSVNNALPKNLLIDLSESSTPAKTSGRSMQTTYNLPTSRPFSLLPMAEVWENSLTIRGVDRHYTGAEYKKYSGVNVNLEGYCPLDWIVVIEELDMADLPRGINEPFYDLVQRNIDVKRIVNSTVLPANLWTAKIDLLYTAIDSVMSSFLDEYLPQNPYMKVGTKEGVYLINAYSGVIRSSQEYAKRDYDVIGLKDKRVNAHRTAALTNLMLTAIDAWSLFSPDDEPISHAALRAAIQNGSRKLSSELGGQLYSQTDLKKVVRILWNVMVEAYKQVTVNAVAEAGKEASKKLSSTIGKAGSKVFAVLAVLDKISTVGRMTERLLGLAGKATNGYSLLDGPTPLESIVVVVGDPFSPSISKIEPNTIWEGLSVTLTGKNFDPKPENNTIAFAAIDALEGETRQEAKVLSVVKKDSSQELTLEVPYLVDNTLYRIYIDTMAGMKTVRSSNVVHYLSIPQLEAISPQVGFATPVVGDDNPLQGSTFKGTKVSLMTKNYYDTPDYSKTILFGGKEVEILPDPLFENPPGVLSVWTPSLSAGTYDVFIQTRRVETDYQSNKKTFTILTKPVLKEISPTKARYGSYVTLTGENFGTDASIVFVQIDDRLVAPYTLTNTRLVFLMPELQEKGQRQLSVWTPSGRSNFLEIEALEGLDTTPPPSLPEGYSMTVTTEESGQNADGKLSLDEAAAVARGELDLWAGGGGWDDTDRELHHIFNQKSDGTWIQGTDSYVSLETSGPGHETLYVYNIYNHNNGNREKVLDYTSSSDSGSEIEEGDLVTGTKGQGGLNFSDSITSQKGLEIRAVNVALGPDDGLDLLRNNSVLHLGGRGINASGQARIRLATVDATQCGAESALTLSSGAHASITGRFVSAPQNAVTLVDSSHSTIEITAKNNGGSAVRIDKGELNRIFGSVDNGGRGVSIDAGNHNQVDSMNFTNVTNPLSLNNCNYNEIHGFVCSATRGDVGIKLSGSAYNNMTDGELSGFSNAAVQISDSKQNLLRDLTIDGNEGDGVIIDKGSEANIVDQFTCTRSRNGVVLMGAGTRLNQLTRIQSGDERWSYWNDNDNPVDPANKEARGNQQCGLHIKDGATENQIEKGDFWGNGKHGVLIEGNSTALNVLKDCNLMSDYVSTRGNGEDGLRIENGANYNTIEECRFSHNGGNGATIRGEGTNFNKLYKCTFGHVVTEYTDGENDRRIPHHTLFPNMQWGASIEDFAYQNQIVECIFAANGSGGLRLHQLAAADEDEYSVLVRDSCFGYKFFVEAMTSVQEKNIWRLWDASGPAVFMDTVTKSKLDTNFIYSHDIGVQMKLSHECTLTDTYSIYNKNSGIVLDQSSNNTVESALISQTAHDAITLNETESNTFIGGVVSGATGNAIVINNSKADVFKQNQVYDAQGDGISIHASENLHLIECDYQEIDGDAMIIDGGSKNVTLDRLHFANNYKSGIILKAVSDIYMIGERPREGFWVFGHPEVGIRVEDSQRIHIGYQGKGINLPGSRGILVTGDKTQDVWIASSIVYDDPFTMSEYAICVENGQNIVIGGWTENERNNIEFNNQDGILITGDKARVSVINNLIGEPEEWESGDGSYGNIVGVHLTNGANNCTVAQNLINANQSYGVLIDGGAHDNAVHQNQITENGDCGVFVEGGASVQNKISNNFFRQNLGTEILLLDGGNTEIAPPTVDRLTWQGDNISGTCYAPKGSRIEMYAGNEVNGYKHIDDSQLYGNNFYGSGYLANNEYVKALVIDPVGNTSMFGNAKSVDSGKDDLGFQTYAFNASLNGNEDIYIQRTSDSKATQLTTDPAVDADPIFSPDGEQILFVSDRDGNKDLWIVNADGTNLQSAISDPAADYDPVWLSDNGQIVYVSERDGNPELYLDSISSGGGGLYYGDFFTQAFQKREGDGGGVQFVTTEGSTLTKFSVYLFKSNYQFNWKILEFDGTPTLNAIAEGQVDPSSQGTADDFEGWFEVDIDDVEVPETFMIAVFFIKNYLPPFGNSYSVEPGYGFWKYENDEWTHLPNGMIMIQANLGGAESGPVRLTDRDGIDRYPSPSPDGKRIAFSSGRSGNMDVWMLDIENGDLTQLTDDPADDVQPAWSPDGEQIAFVSNRDGTENIYLLDVATKSSSRLTEDPARDLDPIWSGSGDSILFASDRDAGLEIYALAVGASKPERLTLMTGDCRNPNAMSVVESYDDSAKIAQRTSASISVDPMQAQSHFTLPTLEAKPGDRVALDVTVQNGSPIGNLVFDIDYDRSALRLVQIEEQETLPMTAYAVAPENFSESTAWPVRYNGIHSTGLSESGKIVTLYFDVKEIVSSKDSFVNFSNVQTYDVSLNDIVNESQNGNVKITVDQTNVDSWMVY